MLTVLLECGGQTIEVHWSGKSLGKLKHQYKIAFQDHRDLIPGLLSVESPAFMLLDPTFLIYYENFCEADITDGSRILVRPEYLAVNNGDGVLRGDEPWTQPVWMQRFSTAVAHAHDDPGSVFDWPAVRQASAASKVSPGSDACLSEEQRWSSQSGSEGEVPHTSHEGSQSSPATDHVGEAKADLHSPLEQCGSRLPNMPAYSLTTAELTAAQSSSLSTEHGMVHSRHDGQLAVVVKHEQQIAVAEDVSPVAGLGSSLTEPPREPGTTHGNISAVPHTAVVGAGRTALPYGRAQQSADGTTMYRTDDAHPAAASHQQAHPNPRRAQVFPEPTSNRQASMDAPPLHCVGNIRHTIWTTISDPNSSCTATCWSILIIVAILAANLFYIAETEIGPSSSQAQQLSLFDVAEYTTLAIFTLEIVLTVVSAPRLRVILDVTFFMDVIVVVPSYMELLSGSMGGLSLSILRVFRLLRVLRLFKVSRSSTMLVITSVRRSLWVLFMFIGLIFIIISIIGAVMHVVERGEWHPEYGEWRREVMWTCLYDAEVRGGNVYAAGQMVLHIPPSCSLEHAADGHAVYACEVPIETGRDCVPSQWDVSPFGSIPASMWWALVTICTVGYGDAVPRSLLGRLAGSFVMLIGLLIIAVPITVIGNNFSEVYREAMLRQQQESYERSRHAHASLRRRKSLLRGVLRHA